MPSRFRWTLTNLSDNSSEVLTRDPIGWDDSSIKLTRDKFYNGVFTDYVLSVKWHCSGGGKEFIDSVYQDEDINANVEVLIEIDCDASGDFVELYRGKLDFQSYKNDGEYTEVLIEKVSLFSKLLARQDISVDLETVKSIGDENITAPATRTIALPSMEIVFENEWEVPEGYTLGFIRNVSDGGFSQFTQFNGFLNKATSNQVLPWIEATGPTVTTPALRADIVAPILNMAEAGIDYPVTVKYDINFRISYSDQTTGVGDSRTNTGFFLNIMYGNPNDPSNSITLFDGTGFTADPYTDTFDIITSGTFNLNAGDVVYLIWFNYYNGSGSGGNYTIDANWFFDRGYPGIFKLTVLTTSPETTTKTMLIHEAFNQVVDAIADSDANFYSEFYGRTDSDKVVYPDDGCGSLLAITNGLNIRQFDDKPILCSLKQLFDSANALHNIGLTIEDGIIRIEPISYFFDKTTQILNLNRPVKVMLSNDPTRYFNNIQMGYAEWETEFQGGLDEPNTRREYSTIVNAVKGAYTQLSNYIASTYAIELTRRHNKNISGTEDFKYDNSNFFLALIRGAYGLAIELYADSFSSGAGMTALNTAYNLRLTPARMLLAHFGNIVACLQTIQGQIKFVKGEGNTTLEVAKDNVGCQEDYFGIVLKENDSINYNESAVANYIPLWLPELIKFEYPITNTQLQSIRNNPHGYISILDDHGNTHKGYVIDIDYKLKTGLTTFTLLRVFE